MPFLYEVHQAISRLPFITAIGLPLFFFAIVTTFYYLRLARRLKEQFVIQQQMFSELQKLNTAVEHSPGSIIITDRSGVIEYVNPAFCRLTGFSREEALGQHTRILKSGLQPPEFYREMWESILAGKEWQGEFHNRRKDGSTFWEQASISPIYNKTGTISHFVAVKEDVTERRQLLECLDQLAYYDKLTGIPNRTLFFDRLDVALATAHREGRLFALLFVDLDGFKQVNDSHGHEAGDSVLQETSRRLLSCIRESDTVARMGGDEFTLILCNLASPGDAGLVADKLISELVRPIRLDDQTVCRIGASIGISLYPSDSLTAEQLVSAADSAMYEVKREGKNGYCYFSDLTVKRLS